MAKVHIRYHYIILDAYVHITTPVYGPMWGNLKWTLLKLPVTELITPPFIALLLTVLNCGCLYVYVSLNRNRQ